MATTMMKLGQYTFALETAAYKQLRRSALYRWQSQDRLSHDPAMQYVGRGKEQIELDGIIYPHFKGGLNQISAMKKTANAGKPLILTDGLGNVWGLWVIEQIEETQEIFTKSGIPRKISFNLTLSKYGED